MSDANDSENKFSVTSSAHFTDWLASTNCSLAFTTYQAGKLFMLGVRDNGRLSVFERTFPRCMGLGVSSDGRSIALATRYQIHRFDNVLLPGQASDEGYDALYAPHAGWVTGAVDAHDIGFGPDDRPIFVNTLFSCIAVVSDSHSFRPIWRPDFVTRLAPEDRCHLNGLAFDGLHPRYATAVSRSDASDGWRDRRADGGVVVDIDRQAIVAEGLSMPHSPRLHEGRLWLLNSGTGEFGFVNLANGAFEAVAFCPGYARGLALIGDHAVVGLSLARDDGAFSGLRLEQALRDRDTVPRCGLAVYHLRTGDMTAWVRLEGVVQELYDVAVLPGVRRPSLVGFKGDDVHYVLSIDD